MSDTQGALSTAELLLKAKIESAISDSGLPAHSVAMILGELCDHHADHADEP